MRVVVLDPYTKFEVHRPCHSVAKVLLWATGPTRLRLITWPCDLDLWPWRSWRLWLMWVVVFHPCTNFEVCRPCHSEDARCMSALMGLLILTFDLWPFILKLICESHQRWGTFPPNLGTLGLWVLEVFAMHATDGQTDGRTDKSNAYCLIPYGREHNKRENGPWSVDFSDVQIMHKFAWWVTLNL